MFDILNCTGKIPFRSLLILREGHFFSYFSLEKNLKEVKYIFKIVVGFLLLRIFTSTLTNLNHHSGLSPETSFHDLWIRSTPCLAFMTSQCLRLGMWG